MELFAKIKKLLKDGYERAGFDVVAEQPNGDTLLRYFSPETQIVTLKLTREDVQEYAELLDMRSEFRNLNGVGMVNNNFREHLLRPLDTAFDDDDLKRFHFAAPAGTSMRLELDNASYVFANFFRFEAGYMQLCLDRLSRIPQRVRKSSLQNPIDIRHTLARPVTARVLDIGAKSVDDALRQSDELIDSALFTLAYDTNLPLMVATDWPPSRTQRIQAMRLAGSDRPQTITLDSAFRRDLVRLYQAGLGAPLAVHQYLAFYQVLELFFQEVNHAGAYDELYHLLRDETIRPSEGLISRIVYVVERHRRNLSAADLLEQLLRQHVGAPQIRQAIQRLGGEAQETLGTLSQRLVRQRDAIVHAGVNGATPGDESLRRDVPLMRFLAEQVIVSTGA